MLPVPLMLSAGPEAWLSRYFLWSRRYVVLIGRISYPLYLWHWPLLCFSRLVRTCSALTVATLGRGSGACDRSLYFNV